MRDEWQTTNIRRRSGGNYGLATVPIQLTALGVKKSIEDTLWSKGIRVTPAKHHEFKGCHGFRKYFKTYAQRTMSSDYVERLLGHTGDWSDAAYNRPLEDWIIEAYLKAVPDLTIYKPAATEEQLQAIVDEQLSAQMESKNQEVLELNERIDKMQQDFKSYDQKVKDAVDKFKDYDKRQEDRIRFYKGQFDAYREIFGPRPLTKSELEKVELFKKQIEEQPKNNPDDGDYEEYIPDADD